MQLLVSVLLIFIVLNSLLKLSFWKVWQTALFALLCGVFVVYAYPYAIQQSKTQLADFLANPTFMGNAAVLVTIEVAISLGFCFVAMNRLFGERSRYYNVLRWFVSVLIFPVLFYVLTQLMFTFTGTDFTTIAWVFGASLLVGIPLISYAIRWLLSEEDLRLEVHFLVSLFTAIIGLICTVNGNISYAATSTPVNVKAVTIAGVLFAVVMLAGFVWYKIKWKFKK